MNRSQFNNNLYSFKVEFEFGNSFMFVVLLVLNGINKNSTTNKGTSQIRVYLWISLLKIRYPLQVQIN